VDYLTQVLKLVVEGMLLDFRAVTAIIGQKPQFIKDSNLAHGHKSTEIAYAVWRALKSIILFPHPSTSPDMNPIKKC